MKRIFTILVVVLLTATCALSQDLLREQHYSTGNFYKAIALKDYNNDGVLDVWSANSTNNHIEIWTYSAANDTLVKVDSICDGLPYPNSFIHDLDVADLDKDGDMDVVATFRYSGAYLCINNGDKSWIVSHLDNSYGWQTIIADFDKDNNLDIFLATDYSYLKIYYGDGTGNFTSGTAPTNANSAQSVGMNAIDIDGDSYLDLIGTSYDYSAKNEILRAYINELDESTPAWSASVANDDQLGSDARSVNNSAGDINGDGYVDLVYGVNTNNVIACMGGEDNGNFTWTRDTLLKDFAGVFSSITMFDIEGDGDLDIIAGGYNNFDGIVLLRNDGQGNFEIAHEEFGYGFTNFHSAKLGDIDGNGADDAIGARYDITNGHDDGFQIFFFKKANSALHVKYDATGDNDGTSWEDAYTSLQTALSNANKGDTIWIAAGTYTPSADKTGNETPDDNRTKTFMLVDSIAVYGGFNGTETDLDQRDWEANETILSGDLGTLNDSTDNCYNIIHGANYATIDGFTITKGNANGTTNNETDMGGGILNKSVVNVNIINCTFKDNSGKQGGAVADYWYSSPIFFTNCIFYRNVSGAGGAIGNWNSKIIAYNCLFVENIADANIMSNMGGAIYNWGAGSNGGSVTNCTFYNNTGDGAIHDRAPATFAKNCIFWNNNGNDIGNTNGGSCDVTYSCIVQSGYAGTGNISDDPMLYDLGNANIEIDANSPCIDTGDPDSPNDPDGTRANMGWNHPIHVATSAPVLTSSDSGITIFPNPAHNIIQIKSKDLGSGNIIICNINGKELIDQKLNNSIVGVSSLKPGIYIYKVFSGKTIKTGKLIIK